MRMRPYNTVEFICSGVYAIVNVITHKRYVGSSQNISTRLRRHFLMLKHGNHHSRKLQNAWNKYGPESFDIEILEVCDDKLFLREQSYIDSLDSYHNGYNGAPRAGEYTATHKRNLSESLRNHYTTCCSPLKGRPLTEETKHLLSIAHKGKIIPAEQRERIAAKLRGVTHSPERIAKAVAPKIGLQHSQEWCANIGNGVAKFHADVGHSEETREKISKTLTGKKQSQETIDKRRATKMANGKKPSPETIAKRLETRRKNAKPLSAESRARISAAKKGCKHTPETKARIASTLKAQRAKKSE